MVTVGSHCLEFEQTVSFLSFTSRSLQTPAWPAVHQDRDKGSNGAAAGQTEGSSSMARGGITVWFCPCVSFYSYSLVLVIIFVGLVGISPPSLGYFSVYTPWFSYPPLRVNFGCKQHYHLKINMSLSSANLWIVIEYIN